jgi:DNA-binding XRE family transcriptional regulator
MIKKMDKKMEFLFRIGQKVDLDAVFDYKNWVVRDWVVKEARKEVGYSKTSAEVDVISSLEKTYKIMLDENEGKGYTGYSKKEYDIDLRDKLTRWRKQHHFTQQKISELLNVNRITVMRWEIKYFDVSNLARKRIQELLNIKVCPTCGKEI